MYPKLLLLLVAVCAVAAKSDKLESKKMIQNT